MSNLRKMELACTGVSIMSPSNRYCGNGSEKFGCPTPMLAADTCEATLPPTPPPVLAFLTIGVSLLFYECELA